MKLIYVLKLCVLAAFVATIITGLLFIIQSSDEQEKRAHAKDLYGNSVKDVGVIKPKLNPKKVEVEKKVIPEKDVDVADVEKEAEVIRPPIIEPVHEPAPTAPTPSTPRPTATTAAITTTTASPPTKAVAPPETIAPKVLKELKETSRVPSVHIFYYPWYGTPAFNGGKYYHWNHMRLKPDGHQSQKPEDHHNPPGDIAAVRYPLLGPYSSSDPVVMERHMKWLSSAGVDVVSVSWYPKGKADAAGEPWDSLMPALLNATDKFKMKLNFHLEPYEGRSAASIRDDIEYIVTKYGSHSAFYRTTPKTASDKTFPLFYVYDSYNINIEEWQKILKADGSMTVRGTNLDSLMIGLYVKKGDELDIKLSGFDGLYTYFASEGFSDGSTVANWPLLSTFCAKENLLFIPSVGPGYDDSAVRPWNSRYTRPRDNGDYYREHFKMAHTAKADIVSITSFNEWHEGTQIEPATSFTDKNGTGFVYAPYDKGPEQYLEITLEMIKAYFTPHSENIPMQIARVV